MPPDSITRRLSDERGFTLIELLTSMIIGIVVLSAAYGLIDVGGHASARTIDRVEAAQRGRVAMNQITQPLRSQVCLDSLTPPIAAGDGNSVTFYADLDDDPYFRPQKRVLRFDPNGAGSIVEQVYASTSVEGPPWTFLATPTRTRTLITDVNRITPDVPVFRFYSFESAALLAVPLSAGTTSDPLPPNSVAKVERVEVSFHARPTRVGGGSATAGTSSEQARGSQLQTSVYPRGLQEPGPDDERNWAVRCA